MNLNDFKIKSSRRDPAYSVNEIEGTIVRRVDNHQRHAVKILNDKRQVFPTISDLNLNLPLDFYEIEKIPFIVFPYELPFQLYKDYALFYLELLEDSITIGSSLKDATPFNIAYTGQGKFLHFDLGSLELYNVDIGWKGYRQFLSEFYFPLIYLKENRCVYTADLVKLFFDKQWIFHYRFSWRNYLNPAFSISYMFYKNSRIKKLDNKQPGKILKVSGQQVLRNIILLKEGIKSLELPKVKTKWDNYYSQTILQNGYVEEKEKVIKSFLEQVKSLRPILYALDWGANDGKFSNLLADVFEKATILSVESDYNAINQLYLKYKAKRIIPIYTDVLNLSPDLGFDGERLSLKNRLADVTDLQLSLGLIHHLVHQENLSFETLIEFFATSSKSKSFLIIEFIDEEDPRHKLIRNPNYPYPLSRTYFIESLKKYYEVLDSKQAISTREIFICSKRS